jgi:hypothetical protein
MDRQDAALWAVLISMIIFLIVYCGGIGYLAYLLIRCLLKYLGT